MTSARRFTRGLAGFMFGLASTVLLIGLWGRAVVVDTDQLAESLTPMARSATVADRFTSWLATELGGTGLDQVTAEAAADHVLENPAVSQALAGVLTEVVLAAASPDPAGSRVDAAEVLAPAVPDITSSLNEVGVPVTEHEVASAVTELDPLVVRQPRAQTLIGRDSTVASRLGTAVTLAVMTMLFAGWSYVAASLDRRKAMRSLFTRFALGALSFAVLLRIGGWILDPGGGRAPVAETLGLLAVSKWLIPLGLGLAAAGGAVVFWVFRRRQLKPVAESRSQPEVSTPPPG
ncbi:MAG TPA: hypothetical protein VI980_01115 [Acidimicrobiia bacterium]|nr:hypothetical protein [Acidimicrobiia bacterium]